MTGLDILKKVLIEDYGCTKQQANAPIVEKVITAMAENSGLIEKCTVNMFEESKRRLKEAEMLQKSLTRHFMWGKLKK